MSVTQDGLVTWTPSGEVQAQVSVRADDGSAFTTQSWTIDVAPAEAELALSMQAQPSIVDPGEPVTISAVPSGMAGQYSLEVQVDGTTVPLDDLNQAQVQLDQGGTYEVTGFLSDAFGTATTRNQDTHDFSGSISVAVIGGASESATKNHEKPGQPRNFCLDGRSRDRQGIRNC